MFTLLNSLTHTTKRNKMNKIEAKQELASILEALKDAIFKKANQAYDNKECGVAAFMLVDLYSVEQTKQHLKSLINAYME